MMNKKFIAAFLGVLVFFWCFCWAQGCALAQMSGIHDHHQHEGQGEHLHATDVANVIVDLETRPPKIVAGNGATVLFSIKDTDGKPLHDLTVTHERLVHVIIASEDFTVFAHIHPEDSGPITNEMKEKAEFPVRFTFPKAGRYIIALDSAVKDIPFSEHFTVDVTGAHGMRPLKKDLTRKKTFGGYEVTLSSEPERIVAGKEATLSYLIKKDGEQVKDLEPYLSALMHLAIIESDLDNFIHTHGELPGSAGGGHMAGHMHMIVPEKFGPKIDAHVTFPARGLYQIFGEIKHRGKVIVTIFMVEVE